MHNLRCEHSTTNSERCRCKCGGREHGIQAPGIVGEVARRRRDKRPLTFKDLDFQKVEEVPA